MHKIILDNYDPITGNASVNGVSYYIGMGIPEYKPATDTASVSNNDSEAVKLAKMGYSAKELIQLRNAGVL